MKSKVIFLVIFLILTMALLFLLPDQKKELTLKKIQVNNCSIMQEKCVVDLGTSSMSLDITPRGMPPTQIAKAVVSFENINVDKVKLGFESPAINYTLPTLPFNKINDKKFTGKAFLSLCTLEKIKWIANLTIYTDDKTFQVSFPFEHSGNDYSFK